MNRFQLEIANLAINSEQGLFQMLNVVTGLTEDTFQMMGVWSRFMAEGRALCADCGNLTSEVAVALFNLAQ